MHTAEETLEEECNLTPKLEELFCNFSPDAAVIFMMQIILMEYLVAKGILKKDEVSEISIKAAGVMGELSKKFVCTEG